MNLVSPSKKKNPGKSLTSSRENQSLLPEPPTKQKQKQKNLIINIIITTNKLKTLNPVFFLSFFNSNLQNFLMSKAHSELHPPNKKYHRFQNHRNHNLEDNWVHRHRIHKFECHPWQRNRPRIDQCRP